MDRIDRWVAGALKGVGALCAGVVLLIAAFLVVESLPVLRKVGPAAFVADEAWHPASRLFNLLPMVAGTLLVSAGALLVATPLGILSAVFCRYYAPRPVAAAWRRVAEVLAGLPSVLYGLWGLTVLVPLVGRLHPPGPSLLAGALILALMVLPTIAVLSEAALAAVPAAYVRGAAALGLSRWGTVRRVALPAARSGLLAAAILAAGRALGETMAVLMVCGNVVRAPSSPFDPVRTLTANIALEMAYAMGDHRSALFVSGLVLLLLVAALSLAAERVGASVRHA